MKQLAAVNRSLEKELQQLKSRLATAQGDELLESAQEIEGIKVLVSEVEGLDSKGLRESAERLRGKLGSSIVVLALQDAGKVSLVAAVSKDLVGRVKAGELVSALAVHVGGKGGGRPDMAMAGGTDPLGLPTALASAGDEIRRLLAAA
ncbi:MAG TPA: hypothetical protein GX696_09145 [Pseudomonadaceae bacterium]|nr:hypothetical protein [Pseudomonadaceae bacterium]